MEYAWRMFARATNPLASSGGRKLLALAIVTVCLISLMTASESGRADEPWPELLSSEPVAIEPEIALLQLRANVALARLVEAGSAVD